MANKEEKNITTIEATLTDDVQSKTEHGAYLPLLPLKDVVILPRSILPIIVGRKSSIEAVEFALKNEKAIFITAQKKPNTENPTIDDVFLQGTRATILQVMRMPNGALKILAEGLCRSQVVKADLSEKFIGVYYEDTPTTSLEKDIEIEALWRQLKTLYKSYTELHEKAPTDMLENPIDTTEDIEFATDTIAVHVNLSFDERQEILETVDLEERMVSLCVIIKKEIEILQTEQRIHGRIQNQMEKTQKEYYLNEQIKAIHKELGRDDVVNEIGEIQKKAKRIGLSPEAHEKLDKELRRLEQMPPLSSEAVVSRSYIDWLISLPWGAISKDTVSVTQAEKILNKSHAGLISAKERILEFLAAKKFSSNLKRSPVICLVGPPGVGKTSLGKAIAQSMNREFVRISLGGVRDEAEIRGHRRTYIGALPGKIIQAMKKAKTANPVILLDEIDKISQDLHGDPASALLEVLDTEQNNSFVDHFLEVEYDLSNVMFVATANVIDNIPYPLYDRMEVIGLSGYTEQEKITIAKKFLIPKNLTEYMLEPQQFKISDDLLLNVINNYTKEAGVRQLERVITKLMRKTIQVILKQKRTPSFTITQEYITEWLGHSKFKKTSLSKNSNHPGLATGLAWTEVGGDVLEVETSAIKGKGGLTLTGQLGEVMQESAQAALSYIRSRTKELGLKSSFHSTQDIHMHLPEGATPKDGPSAGITICSALISALTGVPLKPSLAMTGEITLQGRVLSVGGLKEKILAAQQHGIKTVIVPQENYDDIQDILKNISLKEDTTLVYVSTMDDVLRTAFPNDAFKKKPAKVKKKEQL